MHRSMTPWLPRSALAAFAVAVALTGGCFYDGAINQAPEAVIERLGSGPLFAFERVRLSGEDSTDPDGDGLRFSWVALSCDARGQCTTLPGSRVNAPTLELELKSKDPITVELTVIDSLGAQDSATFPLDVVNRDPQVDTRVSGLPDPRTGALTVGRELMVTAVGTDEDQDSMTFEWRLLPPKLSSPSQVVFEPGEATDEKTSVRRLVPDVAGEWRVEVAVSDGDGGSTTDEAVFFIEPDAPPCLSLTSPEAIPDAPYILLADAGPREFAVLRVSDELDPFPEPATPQASDVGGAEFRWFLGRPGRDFELVAEGATSVYALDPGDFAPGDLVDVRVEVLDRVDRVLPCADEQPTCSIAGDAACLQRVTWRAEIR